MTEIRIVHWKQNTDAYDKASYIAQLTIAPNCTDEGPDHYHALKIRHQNHETHMTTVMYTSWEEFYDYLNAYVQAHTGHKSYYSFEVDGFPKVYETSKTILTEVAQDSLVQMFEMWKDLVFDLRSFLKPTHTFYESSVEGSDA